MKPTRTILDIDSPTRNQIRKALTDNRLHGSLFLPADLQHNLTNYCRCGCGKPLSEVKTANYFGEVFCAEAVEKWSQGA